MAPSRVLYPVLVSVLPKMPLACALVYIVCMCYLSQLYFQQIAILDCSLKISSEIAIYLLLNSLRFIILLKCFKKRSYFVSGLKRPRISENTAILSTSDTGNEDDHDSDSGGELRADRSLSKTVIFFLYLFLNASRVKTKISI